MNTDYIKAIIKDLDEVLTSKDSNFSESDFEKISQAKMELENNLKNKSNTEISVEDKANFIRIILLIIEIIRSISDHWK
jgi:hypothetical protein